MSASKCLSLIGRNLYCCFCMQFVRVYPCNYFCVIVCLSLLFVVGVWFYVSVHVWLNDCIGLHLHDKEWIKCGFVAFDTLTLVYTYTCDHVSSEHPTHPPSPWKRHNPWCPSFPHPEGTGTWGQGWVWVPVRRCLDRNTCSLLDCVWEGDPPILHISWRFQRKCSLSSWFSVPCLITMATVARGSHGC